MGSMSASDAAPLPRLGEVFFDVRGESRSMRLSWYADTGVAVFSIWQGGTCTGTFRLPIADLPRMVEALQRGPHGRDDPMTGEQPTAREPRVPTAPARPGPPGPARSSRPGMLDGDIETGQTTAAIYLPPVESDLTGYPADAPPPDYGPPADGPGYETGPPPQPGYRDKTSRSRRGSYGRSEPAGGPGGYPADPPATDFPGGYPADPPATDFPGGYAADPPAPGFPGEYAGEPLPDLPEDPSHGYAGEPGGRGSGGYEAPPAHGYPGDAPHGYRSEPDTAGYPGEPGGGYLDEETLAPDYRGGYQEGMPGTEPGGHGYRRESRGGRRGTRSSGAAGGPGGRYRDGPPAGGYPGEQDYQDYQEDLAATEYGPPGRPYPPDPRDIDEPLAADPPQRRKPRGRRRAEPAPESFPYGPPPAGEEPRRRGRYPGRP
jgi:hypothetical protein